MHILLQRKNSIPGPVRLAVCGYDSQVQTISTASKKSSVPLSKLSQSPTARDSGSRTVPAGCRGFFKVLSSARSREEISGEEFRHADNGENDLGDWLYRCHHGCNAHAGLCAPSDMERVPARLDGSGRKMRALSMGWRALPMGRRWLGGRWLGHLEWMPIRLHGPGWTLRTLPMGLVKRAAYDHKDLQPQIKRERSLALPVFSQCEEALTSAPSRRR
jgi:hypothetical protein